MLRVPPPPRRTNRTSLVPHPVLIGHAASLDRFKDAAEGAVGAETVGKVGQHPRDPAAERLAQIVVHPPELPLRARAPPCARQWRGA
jgi:hypothetical protein